VPLSPDEIDATNLPHARIGGFNPEATVELLRRIASDYDLLFHESRKLTATVEELRKAADGLTSEIEALRSANAARRDPDEAARVAITAAQRAARELRESARSDCELALKKARRRAGDIEAEFERLSVRLEAWLLSMLTLVDEATEAESSKSAIDSALLGRLGETAAAVSSE
jgi:cell division septum initiation protein DivIVA